MNIIIKENRSDIIQSSVDHIVERINAAQGTFVLGLSTGLTAFDICEALAEKFLNKEVSFKNVHVFIAGEFLGFNFTHPNHYIKKLQESFFSKVDIDPKSIHSLDGMIDEDQSVAECARFEEELRNLGGMDLFVGSLGSNANLAFNEPSSSLKARTRLKTLTSETLKSDARFFGDDMTKVPHKALTMGMGTISEAKEVLIVVYGIQKAHSAKNALESSVSDSYPASILQMHPATTFFVDKVAGRFLSRQFL
ncbi:MAG: glucosamine-6-phosphate deaminase [Brevinema sp.]